VHSAVSGGFVIRSECSTAGVPVGGNGRACAGLWVLIALVAVGLLPPAFSLCPQAPPGKKAWWNAKAGAAITPSMRAEANVTAKNVFSLTNRDLLPLRDAAVPYTPHFLLWIVPPLWPELRASFSRL
jgi:hypothetical protein